MSKPYIIILAGAPASGKTTYGRHLVEKMRLPFISKDAIKEKLHDVLKYDNTGDNSRLYGAASYSVFYHIADCLMKAGTSFILESNFTVPQSTNTLQQMVREYGYKAITVLFDADVNVLKKRYIDRDTTDERHPGLRMDPEILKTHYNTDKEAYRNFCVGEKIVVDTTDLEKLNYDEVDKKLEGYV